MEEISGVDAVGRGRAAVVKGWGDTRRIKSCEEQTVLPIRLRVCSEDLADLQLSIITFLWALPAAIQSE